VSIHLHPPIHENIEENKPFLAMKPKHFIIHSRGSVDGDE